MSAPRRTVEEIAKDIHRGRPHLREPALYAVRHLAEHSPKLVKRGRAVNKAARKTREATDRLQALLRSLEQEELIREFPNIHMIRLGFLNIGNELRATIAQLVRARRLLYWLERLGFPDPRAGDTQQICANMAFGLIKEDGMPPRELRRTASLLYEAASGKPNMDLKRYCVRARKNWDASQKNRTEASQTR
jgi:hypothetical protein